jgi:hypothetical protein
MAKPKVTATDRLQNVIEVVDLGRRSGLLAVERGSGPAVEEGEIYFMNGRAIYAAVGALRGREALNVLVRWGECRFAFDPNAPRPTPNVSGVLPSLDMIDHTRGVRSSPPATAPSGPFGQPSGPFTGPSGPLAPPSSQSGPFAPAGGPSGPFGPAAGSSGSWPFPPQGMPGQSMPGAAAPPYPGTSYPNQPYDASQGAAYGQNPQHGRKPRRAPDVRDLMTIVATYNLSRGHRTILLLADGEHTIIDLARLSSKSVDEVVQLLAELEHYGLVYYYS